MIVERLQRFPTEISSGDITAFFTLAATDLAYVRKQRGAHNRLLIEVGGWVNLPVFFEHAGGSQPTSPEQLVLLYGYFGESHPKGQIATALRLGM
jgi:hypothetical protein